ncbi:Slp family lipoprotein [Escherichia coli]
MSLCRTPLRQQSHAATRFSSGDEAPQLYVGQEARFGGKAVAVQNQQGKTRLKLLPYRWTASQTDAGRTFSRLNYADVNGFWTRWISVDNWLR